MRQCVNGCGEARIELMGVRLCWACYAKCLAGWADQPIAPNGEPTRDRQLSLFEGGA